MERRAGGVALVAGGVGGLLLLAATFLPWSERGAGSTIALRRIADLVLSGTIDAWVPRWAGFGVYCIPMGGGLLLIGIGLGRRAGLALAATGVVLGALGTAVSVAALDHLDPSGVGGGTVAAVAGAMLGMLGVGAGWVGHRAAALPSDQSRGEPTP